MMFKKSALLGSAFAVFLAGVSTSLVSAQSAAHAFDRNASGSQDVSFNVGIDDLSGIDGNKHVSLGGSWSYQYFKRAAFIADYTWLPLGSQNQYVSNVQVYSQSEHAQLFDGGLRYDILHFGSNNSNTFYGLAAVGYDSDTYSVSSQNSGYTYSAKASSSDTFLSVGAGATFPMGDRWGFRPEARYYSGLGGFMRVQAGVYYRFGR